MAGVCASNGYGTRKLMDWKPAGRWDVKGNGDLQEDITSNNDSDGMKKKTRGEAELAKHSRTGQIHDGLWSQ